MDSKLKCVFVMPDNNGMSAGSAGKNKENTMRFIAYQGVGKGSGYFFKAVFPSDISHQDGKRWSSMKDIRSKHTDFTFESVLRNQMSLAKLRIKRSKNS